LPPNKKPIGLKWVFKIKTTATGMLERFKARLVVQGFRQVPGIDFQETYAPVSKLTSFRILMAMVAVHNWQVIQLDVKNAFLYGDLEETELYTRQPPGMEDGTGRVCRLVKSLYGLKQAPLVWYETMGHFLRTQLDYQQLDTDWAVFRSKTEKTYIMIYVDDIMVVSRDKEESNYLVCRPKQRFYMTEEAKDKYLGINLRIDPVAGDVQLSLQRYCGQLVHKYNLDTQGPHLSVPITKDPNTEAEEPAAMSQEEIRTYQGKVGNIMWAAATVRPDVQLASSKLAQGN
jgi:hypothetical protein